VYRAFRDVLCFENKYNKGYHLSRDVYTKLSIRMVSIQKLSYTNIVEERFSEVTDLS